MLTEEDKNEIQELINDALDDFASGSAFSLRKITDSPTESLSLVNRRFVTLNGALTARPVSSVAVVGQMYLDTTNNKPMWYTTAGWRDGVGSIIAQNN